jgi:hypothetical protein
VTADDDVLDAKGEHGVLDGGRDAAMHLAVGGHDVACVPADEEIAGVALQDHVGHDAGVRAGDEECGGFLVVGQVLEQSGTLGEHVGAKARISFKESLHGLPRFVFVFSCSSVHEPRRGDGRRVKTRRLSWLSARSALP